jgi:hypothetical protein
MPASWRILPDIGKSKSCRYRHDLRIIAGFLGFSEVGTASAKQEATPD